MARSAVHRHLPQPMVKQGHNCSCPHCSTCPALLDTLWLHSESRLAVILALICWCKEQTGDMRCWLAIGKPLIMLGMHLLVVCLEYLLQNPALHSIVANSINIWDIIDIDGTRCILSFCTSHLLSHCRSRELTSSSLCFEVHNQVRMRCIRTLRSLTLSWYTDFKIHINCSRLYILPCDSAHFKAY